MSAYPADGFPPHQPHPNDPNNHAQNQIHAQTTPHHHQHHQHQHAQVSSPGGHHSDGLSAHPQHGIPIALPLAHTSPYQYEHPGPHQLQQTYNGHANGHDHGGVHNGGGHNGVVHSGGDVQLHQRQVSMHPATPTSGGEETPKGNRLRKACDSCSIRKVKCDESGPPCRACAALDIPCTFDRPSRRRGPPNKHAEAIRKKTKLEGIDTSGVPLFATPTSPNNVAETLASFSSHAVLNAESILPFDTLELLVDDFFTYIHPLCPFPHEPSFRMAFKDREDLRTPSFLALLASMIGALVASYPRKPRQHLVNHNRAHLFPNSMSLIERCHKIAVEARGSGYLDKELSVYTAATSYFLGLAGAYTFEWKQCRLYFGETLSIARVLGAHKAKDAGVLQVGALPATFGGSSGPFKTQPQTVDFIRQEIGRRIYWVMFVGICSIQQLGSSFGELLMPPATPNDPYPPLPMEVDDEHIFVSHINPQPAGIVSKLNGFNLNFKVYLSLASLSKMELAYGIDVIFDWESQKAVLEECLEKCKKALEGAPAQLILKPGAEPGAFANPQYYPPTAEGLQSNGEKVTEWQLLADPRRQLQFEIQKANIYGSQLGTRSYIVEKFLNLEEMHENMKHAAEAQPSSSSAMESGLDPMLKTPSKVLNPEFLAERESIIKDLLGVLRSISQENMEPNGGSFINKIRQIASTLMNTSDNRKGPTAIRAEEYLREFLEVLMKLERVSPLDNGFNDITDDAELNTWANMRESQMRFAQAGGFLSEL